ncbi:MAG: chemotaxis protein CheA [Pseudobdellovibrio sp.]
MDDFEKELKLGFLDEAMQSMADVEQCFLSLETNPDDVENLNKIFRLAHNLKGSSKAVGFSEMGAFTHEFETFILKVKNKELNLSSRVIDLLLRANDFVITMVDGLKNNLEATFQFDDLLNEMKDFSNNEGESSADGQILEEEDLFDPSAAKIQLKMPEVVESSPALDALEIAFQKAQEEAEKLAFIQENSAHQQVEVMPEPILASALEAKPKLSTAQTPMHAAAPTPAPVVAKKSTSESADENIRVSLKKVENLINTVGEIVILQSVLNRMTDHSDSLDLKKTVRLLNKITKEIQDTAMAFRMVPVKTTFQKMNRIVRDTSAALGKEVQLNLVGEETEIDKTILEKINDPLVHLIRNSVDHGIESAEKRKAAGKPEKGTVDLRAVHQSGRLIIEIQDDGAGLNPEKLKAKAIEKGFIKSGQVLTDEECYLLIFAAGFSTKDQVSDVSGRGVGMDVVKTNIQELNGEIKIESKLGIGTKFTISLPLTLAIIQSLVVKYHDHRYIIPLNHVFETIQIKEYKPQYATGIGDVINLRGESIRLFRLGDFFSIKAAMPLEEQIAIIVRSGPVPFAISVDDILGQFEVVVKQLSPEMNNFMGVSGTTILGDGNPALILEPLDLLKRKVKATIPTISNTTNTVGERAA